jgi:undecaprenyl diphosphate synthase
LQNYSSSHATGVGKTRYLCFYRCMANPNTPPNTLLIPDGHRRWSIENDTSYQMSYERLATGIVDVSAYLGALGTTQTWISIARPLNFERTPQEVSTVLDACLQIHEYGERQGKPLNVHVAGRLDMLPGEYRERFQKQTTLDKPDRITSTLMFGWDAQTEVTDLCTQVAQHPELPTDMTSLISRSVISERIDFIVRTGVNARDGGRVSGIAPWHSLDAEMYFTPTTFPDFTTEDMASALQEYAQRGHKNVMSLPEVALTNS